MWYACSERKGVNNPMKMMETELPLSSNDFIIFFKLNKSVMYVVKFLGTIKKILFMANVIEIIRRNFRGTIFHCIGISDELFNISDKPKILNQAMNLDYYEEIISQDYCKKAYLEVLISCRLVNLHSISKVFGRVL